MLPGHRAKKIPTSHHRKVDWMICPTALADRPVWRGETFDELQSWTAQIRHLPATEAPHSFRTSSYTVLSFLPRPLDYCPPPPTTLGMGWFTSNPSPSPATPKPTADGAFVAPDRSARDRCYETRDAFFACLDRANIVDSIKEADRAEQECGGLEKGMGRECAASWVRLWSGFQAWWRRKQGSRWGHLEHWRSGKRIRRGESGRRGNEVETSEIG